MIKFLFAALFMAVIIAGYVRYKRRKAKGGIVPPASPVRKPGTVQRQRPAKFPSGGIHTPSKYASPFAEASRREDNDYILPGSACVDSVSAFTGFDAAPHHSHDHSSGFDSGFGGGDFGGGGASGSWGDSSSGSTDNW